MKIAKDEKKKYEIFLSWKYDTRQGKLFACLSKYKTRRFPNGSKQQYNNKRVVFSFILFLFGQTGQTKKKMMSIFSRIICKVCSLFFFVHFLFYYCLIILNRVSYLRNDIRKKSFDDIFFDFVPEFLCICDDLNS